MYKKLNNQKLLLLKNNNFLNNQNYVFSKKLKENINFFVRTGNLKEKWYSEYLLYQTIKVSDIKDKEKNFSISLIVWLLLIFFCIFLIYFNKKHEIESDLVNNIKLYLNFVLFIFIISAISYFLNLKKQKIYFYRNKDEIIIRKIRI